MMVWNLMASLFVWLAFLSSTPGDAAPKAPSGLPTEMIMLDNGEQQFLFQVEIAVSNEEQQKGLMFRESLGDREGMFFPFPRERRASFWMKNTLIPLDLIFLASDGTIVNIVANAEPHSLKRRLSRGRVRAVLEINGGLSKTLGIEPGDVVRHRMFDNLEPCEGNETQDCAP